MTGLIVLAWLLGASNIAFGVVLLRVGARLNRARTELFEAQAALQAQERRISEHIRHSRSVSRKVRRRLHDYESRVKRLEAHTKIYEEKPF